MKKVILFTVIIFCAAAVSFAQRDKLKLSVGAELGFATGGFSNTHSIGIGGSAQLEIPLQEKLQGVAYGGILLYTGKGIPGESGKKYSGVTIIPLRIGIKYFLTGSVYGGLQAGLGFISGNEIYNGAAFSYSPQIGYEFKTNSGKSIDVTFKYDAYVKSGTLGSFGLRVAYIF